MWSLWARASHPAIALGRTNMFCESHSRCLKHISGSHRPRLDHSIWIIFTKVAAHFKHKITQRHLDRSPPRWWKPFSDEWKTVVKRDQLNDTDHITIISDWVCSCEYFRYSRFKLCKHLVSKKATPNSHSAVTRRQTHSFIQFAGQGSTNCNKDLIITGWSTEVKNIPEDGFDDDAAQNSRDLYKQMKEEMNRFTVEFEEELDRAKSNPEQLQVLHNTFSFDKFRKYREDVQKYHMRKTVPNTWSKLQSNQNLRFLK
jgi:hypothetical protein